MPDQTQTGIADIHGAPMYYEATGTGHPLILVHAGIADNRMWDDQVRVFAQHFWVLRYDMRGYGKTPIVAGAFSHWQDLHDLMKFLGITQAHLLGCSKGGAAVLDFALEHPRMVSALVLVASAPGGYRFEGDPPPQWDEMVAAFKQGDFARAAELEVQIWVDGPQRKPEQVDSTVRARVQEMDMIALANEAKKLGEEQPREPAAVNRLHEIAAPTLVVIGDLDDANLVKSGEVLAGSISHAQKVVISGAAHLPNMEKPEEFNRAVLDFLTGL